MISPHRVLFPIGVLWALAGAGVWPLHALGLSGWPGLRHRLLMMQGFEACFVFGFLLTAMPGLTRGAPCRPRELALSAAAGVASGACALAGWTSGAAFAFAAGLLVVLAAFLPRVARAKTRPAEEFAFVAFGLACGLAAAVLQIARDAGAYVDPSPRFADRLLPFGMVLSLVLGLGGLLVPVFAGMRDPLRLPGIAAPHERRGRRAFVWTLVLGLALALALEALGRPVAGAWLRAGAGTASGLVMWKIGRPPGRRTIHGWALWTAGWCTIGGLWLAALAPAWALTAHHLVFIGGFGLLTLAIATRVVVSHEGHALEHERAILGPLPVAALGLALALRFAADVWPLQAPALLGASGAAWLAGWAVWALRAWPRPLRIERTAAAR